MKRDRKTFYICLTGLMAALACVSNYISIATPASRIHIGNAVCVLSGLLLGPLYGFFAAAIGNGLFDIIGGYGMEHHLYQQRCHRAGHRSDCLQSRFQGNA